MKPSSYKYQISFSRWGEKLHLTAPAQRDPCLLRHTRLVYRMIG
jgi:hypothetical protein